VRGGDHAYQIDPHGVEMRNRREAEHGSQTNSSSRGPISNHANTELSSDSCEQRYNNQDDEGCHGSSHCSIAKIRNVGIFYSSLAVRPLLQFRSLLDQELF
jgi:hypothetical protein